MQPHDVLDHWNSSASGPYAAATRYSVLSTMVETTAELGILRMVRVDTQHVALRDEKFRRPFDSMQTLVRLTPGDTTALLAQLPPLPWQATEPEQTRYVADLAILDCRPQVDCGRCKRFGEIDCPKCGARGGWNVNVAVQKRCPRCGGSQVEAKIVCPLCKGAGIMQCPGCGGDGQRYATTRKTFPRAFDSVEVQLRQPGVQPQGGKCSSCDGRREGYCQVCTGTREIPRRCSGCQGGFVIVQEPQWQTCDACSGNRRVKCPDCFGEGELRCADCEGTGKLAAGTWVWRSPSVSFTDFRVSGTGESIAEQSLPALADLTAQHGSLTIDGSNPGSIRIRRILEQRALLIRARSGEWEASMLRLEGAAGTVELSAGSPPPPDEPRYEAWRAAERVSAEAAFSRQRQWLRAKQFLWGTASGFLGGVLAFLAVVGLITAAPGTNQSIVIPIGAAVGAVAMVFLRKWYQARQARGRLTLAPQPPPYAELPIGHVLTVREPVTGSLEAADSREGSEAQPFAASLS